MSLLDLVMAAQETTDKEMLNEIIKEITYRQYVPFEGKTFEEMLVENGYKVKERHEKKRKEITYFFIIRRMAFKSGIRAFGWFDSNYPTT